MGSTGVPCGTGCAREWRKSLREEFAGSRHPTRVVVPISATPALCVQAAIESSLFDGTPSLVCPEAGSPRCTAALVASSFRASAREMASSAVLPVRVQVCLVARHHRRQHRHLRAAWPLGCLLLHPDTAPLCCGSHHCGDGSSKAHARRVLGFAVNL